MKTQILVLTCLLLSIPCSADIISVDPNGTGDYPTIQAAIDAASVGDTVTVAGRIYTENVSSVSQITIHFTQNTTINGQVTTGIGTDIISDADLTINSDSDITLGGTVTISGMLGLYAGVGIVINNTVQAFEIEMTAGVGINVGGSVNGTVSVEIYAGTDIMGAGNVTGGSVAIYSGGVFQLFRFATIYVDKDAAGNNDGTSWDDAFNNLYDALDASWPSDKIFVAEGTYLPDTSGLADPREASFALKNWVTVKGGFAGYGSIDPNARDVELYETILSGDLNSDDGPDFVNNDENSYHVVTGSNTNETAILDGFTIRGGNADQRWPSPHSCGGGIYNYSSSLTIIDCQIVENKASEAGGGIYCKDSNPAIINCLISKNSGGYRGGGIDCYFNGRPTITGCTVTGNFATIGGGITSCNGPISNCTITDNTAGEGGGLAFCKGNISSCYIMRNTGGMGGGLKHCDGLISNCTISGNMEGGGLFACYGLIVNCTIIGNSSSAMAGGGLYACRGSITNCIIWSNRAKNGYVSQYASCSTPVSSCVQGGCEGGDCIISNPCFIQPGYWDGGVWVDGDYRLQPTSPCIDAGDNSVVDANSVDLDGNPRISDGDIDGWPVVDMGAYELLTPIEADVHIVPRVINRNNRMKRVMAIIRLPAGIGKGDVVGESFEPYAGGLDSEPIGAIWERVIGWGNMTRVFALFDKDELMDVVPNNGRVELTVVGRLESGQYIYGSDTVRIIQPWRWPRRRLKLR